MDPTVVMTVGRRGWMLRALLLEKTVQHVFVTWAFAADRFGIREDVAVDYRWLMISGGVVAGLFALAAVAHVRGRRWSLVLAGGLALFDIVGEFVAQGGPSILITFSFLFAILVLALSVVEFHRTRPLLALRGASSGAV